MGNKDFDVYGDSQLVINQFLEEFEVKQKILFCVISMSYIYWIARNY